MSYKFGMFATGPLVKYRFDILLNACPDVVKNHLVVLTDDYSRTLYKEYENSFTFVSLNELRHDHMFSKVNEPILEKSDVNEYALSLDRYYNKHTGCGRLWSYDLQRFLLKYMQRHGILNFALIDTDFIVNDNIEVIEGFFNSIPSGTIYTLFYSIYETINIPRKFVFFHKELQALHPNLNFSKDPNTFHGADGWIRGFHFKTTDDLNQFFNVWNKSIEVAFNDPYWYGFLTGGRIIWDNWWMFPWIAQYFESIGYSVKNYFDFQKDNNIGAHLTRPEDTFYWGPRGNWERYEFNYSDVTSIAAFVKNNKEQLKQYYGTHFPYIEITDSHVYTSFKGWKK